MAERKNVVVVPGFMGSSLFWERSFGDSSLIWADVPTLLLRGPDDMQLKFPGPGPGPLSRGQLVSSGQVDGGPYPALMDALRNDGYAPLFWDYDWRLSVQASANALADFLVRIIKGENYWIMAHSMGGLVARLAFEKLRVEGHTTGFQRIVHLGVPHGGSYSAVTPINGDVSGASWTYLVAVLCQLPKLAAAKLLGGSSVYDRFLQVLATWPALYELMPSEFGPWQGKDANIGRLDTLADFTVNNPNVLATYLSQGVSVRATLNSILSNPQPPQICVVGVETDTPTLTPGPGLSLKDFVNYGWTSNGDGVVTLERGTLPGVPVVKVKGEHRQLPVVSGVRLALPQLLEGTWPGISTLPDPIPAPSNFAGPRAKPELAPKFPAPGIPFDRAVLGQIPPSPATPVNWPQVVRGDP